MSLLPECRWPGCGSPHVRPGADLCPDHEELHAINQRQLAAEQHATLLDQKKKWRQKNERAWRRRWRTKSLAYRLAMLAMDSEEDYHELKELANDAYKTANGQHRGTTRKADRKIERERAAKASDVAP